MSLRRPTLQARKGFDPTGYGPGIMSPFGYSPGYRGGKVHHNGDDYFWLGKESAEELGISTEQSKMLLPVVDGRVHHIDDPALGLGMWQQIDPAHRFYWWHCRDRQAPGDYSTVDFIGRMGSTGTSGGDDDHVHTEVRQAPYRMSDRINPAPFFADLDPSGEGKPLEEEDEVIAQNFVDADTRKPNGEHTSSTVCMTVWASGAIQIYNRVIPADPKRVEFAVQMSNLFGPHRPVTKDVFESIRDAHLQLQAAGGASGGFTSRDRARLQAVPTAAENGKAARAEIVK